MLEPLNWRDAKSQVERIVKVPVEFGLANGV